MLVFAYMPGCPHCEKFKPTWNQFKQKYNHILDIREINSDREPKVVEKLQIEGFPTVFLLTEKKRFDFQGPRTVEGLENFVKQHLNAHLQHQLSRYRSLKN